MSEPMKPRRCKAHTTAGNPCRRAPILGGEVCPSHGGRAPQVKAAAERRHAAQALEADARAVLAFEAVEPIADPVLALAELAAEVRATLRALGQRVNALQDPRYVSPLGTEQTRAELTLLGQYQDRLARMLTALGQFDLDDRRVRITEAQAAVVVQVLDRLFAFLDLEPQRKAEADAEVVRIFRSLDQDGGPA
ncbi:hypothetical protein K7G68_08915 [Micrococcus luteus]|uniref:hypothetical protein n=1 Tax=Micrococcus luteus TaxID=1270 RepID=UPI001CA628EC|nr:hypothetical protein [Micrococcus luteus]QZY83673.1 hypothetical protein K7G68_08915 [Micrococcus luteus]